MRLFLLPFIPLLPIVLSTLVAAGPLPHLLGNTPQARAPALSSQKSSLTAPGKARSVHDAIHMDSKEGLVVLPKRDVFADLGHIFDKFGCDIGALVGGQCGCPGVEC